MPEPIRRVSWRVWMVVRVPFYAVRGVLMGVFGLGVCALMAFAYGTFAYMAGGIAGLVVGLVLSIATGAPASDHYADVGGRGGVVAMVLCLAVAGIVMLFGALRELSPWSWIRSVAEATALEWREAADRWPSWRRRSASPAYDASPWSDGDGDESDVRDEGEEDEETIEPEPICLEPVYPGPIDRSEPIIAWRGWNIEFESTGPFSRQPVLSSLGVVATWDTARLAATCLVQPDGLHNVDGSLPSIECTCGIYAVNHPNLVPSYGGDLAAFGAVKLTGRVLEAARGYRAEHARIIGPLTVVVECSGCEEDPVAILSMPGEEMPVCDTCRELYEGVPAFPIEEFAAQLQARLELRYGVDVRIKKGAHQWT